MKIIVCSKVFVVTQRRACATDFLWLGHLCGYQGATPACMGPEDDAVGIWAPGELVMHTLWLNQSTALQGSTVV
jgi:hypothetical protein